MANGSVGSLRVVLREELFDRGVCRIRHDRLSARRENRREQQDRHVSVAVRQDHTPSAAPNVPQESSIVEFHSWLFPCT